MYLPFYFILFALSYANVNANTFINHKYMAFIPKRNLTEKIYNFLNLYASKIPIKITDSNKYNYQSVCMIFI